MKKRNWLTAIAALLLLALAAVFLFQRPIGLALYERALDSRVGRDATADLPDGLHIALCGTGSPLPNPDRAGPCNIIIAGEQLFVVDIGEGGARNINLMALPIGRVDGLFLTHFHSDHFDGIGPLMLLRWTGGTRAAPLPVYGPGGVEHLVAGFNAAYRTDHGYRIAHHGTKIVPPPGAGATAVPFVTPTDAQPVVVFEKDGLEVIAFKVDHGPVAPAVGYRFDYKGRSVVISGDTIRSAGLDAAAKGADLLVHDALQPRMLEIMTAALDAKGQANIAQITRDIVNYHATPEDAADAAKAAGVKQLVLSHLVPPIPGRYFNAAFLGDAAARFDGPIIMGADGMLFSLPAGSTEIRQRQLK